MKTSVKDLEIEIKKLQFEKGDILACTFPEEATYEEMAEIADELSVYAAKYDIYILCLPHGGSIEHIPEYRMQEFGWFKFDPDRMI